MWHIAVIDHLNILTACVFLETETRMELHIYRNFRATLSIGSSSCKRTVDFFVFYQIRAHFQIHTHITHLK